MRPVMVPRRPISVQMFASDHSAPMRVFTSGKRVGHRLFHRLRDGGFTAVQPVEAGLRDARDRSGGCVAQLLRAVDVVRREQLAELLEERLGVQVAAAEEVDRTFDNQADDDGQEERVDDEEGPALLEDIT